MKTMPKMLHTGIAVLLALCLIISTPVTALAAGTDPVENAVAIAEKYGALSDMVVDLMINNFFENGTYNGVFVTSLSNNTMKGIIIDVIVDMLAEEEKAAMLQEYGIEPTEANREMLANTIYNIAVNYHTATNNNTQNLDAGKRQAGIEVMQFALTEVEELEDADAEVYYNLYEVSKTEGHEAAVEKAKEYFHAHSYEAVVTAPTCTEDGYTTYTCACGDSYVGDEVDATGHHYVDGACDVCGAAEPDYTPGDINGDGKVNNKDLTRLFQYLSDWDVEVVEAALDVNGDGKTNNKDLTRLFQYLSDWDVAIF